MGRGQGEFWWKSALQLGLNIVLIFTLEQLQSRKRFLGEQICLQTFYLVRKSTTNESHFLSRKLSENISYSTKTHLVWPFPEVSDAEESERPIAANPSPVQFSHCVQITKLLCGIIQAVIASSSFSSPSGKSCLHLPSTTFKPCWGAIVRISQITSSFCFLMDQMRWTPELNGSLLELVGLDSYCWLQEALS